MASKIKIEAGNQLLTALTAEEIARRTKEPVNKVLEDFLPSETVQAIYDLETDQRFYGPAALADEYLSAQKSEV